MFNKRLRQRMWIALSLHSWRAWTVQGCLPFDRKIRSGSRKHNGKRYTSLPQNCYIRYGLNPKKGQICVAWVWNREGTEKLVNGKQHSVWFVRTGMNGLPQNVLLNFRLEPYHLTSIRNFRNFLSNGKHPRTHCHKRGCSTRMLYALLFWRSCIVNLLKRNWKNPWGRLHLEKLSVRVVFQLKSWNAAKAMPLPSSAESSACAGWRGRYHKTWET